MLENGDRNWQTDEEYVFEPLGENGVPKMATNGNGNSGVTTWVLRIAGLLVGVAGIGGLMERNADRLERQQGQHIQSIERLANQSHDDHHAILMELRRIRSPMNGAERTGDRPVPPHKD